MMRKFTYAVTFIAGLLATGVLADQIKNPMIESPTWEDLRFDVVGDAALQDGAAILEVQAPYRAHDAATVPIVLKQLDPAVSISKATVVIDENPAPVAAVLGFSEAMMPLDFELRVRVNQYSNVRVISQTPQGLNMTGRYVKASGGCSAPASKDPELALAGMGQMKLRSFEGMAASSARQESQIMIRHPNYSGLQRDQITQLFIPAHFIDHLEVWQDEELLFTMDGGISISENPVFRFSYINNGATTLRIKATDTEGNEFLQEIPKNAQG